MRRNKPPNFYSNWLETATRQMILCNWIQVAELLKSRPWHDMQSLGMTNPSTESWIEDWLNVGITVGACLGPRFRHLAAPHSSCGPLTRDFFYSACSHLRYSTGHVPGLRLNTTHGESTRGRCVWITACTVHFDGLLRSISFTGANLFANVVTILGRKVILTQKHFARTSGQESLPPAILGFEFRDCIIKQVC